MSVGILVLNDVHIAASPPLGCRDSYTRDVQNMLEEAKQYAIDNKCQYTVFTGDLFHYKRNTPHWLVRWLVNLFSDWPGTRFAIAGNHDLSYEGLQSIPSQPIGVLFESGSLKWLATETITHDDGVTIQWSPANYRDDIDHDPANFGLQREKGITWAIKVAHGAITPPGKPFPFHVVPMDTIPTEGMDLCLFGHPHYDVGVHEVNGCTFACLGSIGRTQRTEENREREMRLLMVELTPNEMHLSELPLNSALPADELFLEMPQDEVELSSAMQRFASSVSAAIRLEEGTVDEVLATITTDDTDARAKKRLLDYLDKAGF